MSKSLTTTDCVVRCQEPDCGHEDRVSFAECMANGWPSHCRRPMALVSVEDGAIESAVRDATAPARLARDLARDLTP